MAKLTRVEMYVVPSVVWNGPISWFVCNIMSYFCAKCGAFITKCTIVMLCHYTKKSMPFNLQTNLQNVIFTNLQNVIFTNIQNVIFTNPCTAFSLSLYCLYSGVECLSLLWNWTVYICMYVTLIHFYFIVGKCGYPAPPTLWCCNLLNSIPNQVV